MGPSSWVSNIGRFEYRYGDISTSNQKNSHWSGSLPPGQGASNSLYLKSH